MITEKTFRRPVSPTERLYLSARELSPPFAIAFAIPGEGDVDPDRLRRAVAAAAAACPGARLIRVGDEWVDARLPPRVRVITDHALSPTVLDDDPVLAGPLGPTSASTCEVLLLTAPPVTLVFRAFHGVMDAAGLRIWAGEVFRALRGEPPVGAPDPVADRELVARLDPTVTPTRLLPVFRSPLGRGPVDPAAQRFLLRHRSVPAIATAPAARIAAALADAAGGRTRVMVPVDLRRHDTTLRSTANLALPLFLDITPGTDWTEVHTRMLVDLLRRRELDQMDNGGLAGLPPAVVRAALRAAHRFGARTGRNLVSAIVSHAGRVDLADLTAPGFVAIGARALPAHTGLVPLSIAVLETAGHTELTVSCRNGRGIPDRLDALLDRLAAALDDASDPPSAPARRDHPATLDELLRARVAATPDAPAVITPDSTMSYAELGARSAVVAAVVAESGVRRGDLVAVLADRTTAAVAAQWGVLAAGAAFLPLDPRHPADRLRETVRDSGARLCLTQHAHVTLVGDAAPTRILDDLPDTPACAPPPATTSPDDVAYVTYTSGSTGRPKGVRVTHRGVLNYLAGASDWYRLGPETRYAHYHTPAADMACMAMVSPVYGGGAVVLIPGEINHLTLRSMLGESTANTYLLTPSLAEIAVRLDITPTPARAVILGGEALTRPLAAAVRAFFGPHARVLNSYGPTEVSLVCATRVLTAHDESGDGPVPIGVPTPGTTAHLLDENAAPVPDGDVGELYLGGPQVAAGYLGRPGLTAARFVPVRGERCYRSGDLARRLPDGSLEFVGRTDHQVKIRGNRVEPDEVRAVLEGHPAVRAAAVIGRRRPDRTGYLLAAFVVAGRPVDDAELRAYLSERLPTYMIPHGFTRMTELPLTANGKLDRSALPGAAPIAAPTPAADAPDETVLSRVQAIWATVLRRETYQIGSDADFFALGGDSLASVQMLAQVSRDIVGPAGENAFVAALEGLAHRLTPARVAAAATEATAGVRA